MAQICPVFASLSEGIRGSSIYKHKCQTNSVIATTNSRSMETIVPEMDTKTRRWEEVMGKLP
jgi:hypothetical protein